MSSAASRRRNQETGHFPHQHSTSPSTGQTRTQTSPPRRAKRDRSKSNASAVVPPSELFPLDGLLQQLLNQEGNMWVKNELLLQSLRPNPNQPATVELEVTDGVSLKSLVNSSVGTQTPDIEEEQNTNGLYFITYGRLTNSIHKYFRRLERKHACLYLTARKAKHDRLRHVERPDHVGHSQPDMPPDVSRSAVSALASDGGRQPTNLRDEDLLVYRCALMCAQFPMLSAPEPPDGHSPSPPPVALPLKFPTSTIGSPESTDLSRTAPAEFLNTYGPHIANNLHDSTQQNGHTNGHPSTNHHQETTTHQNGAMGHSSLTQVTTGNGTMNEPAQSSKKSGSRRPSHAASTSSTEIVPVESSDSPEVKRKVLKVDELDGEGGGGRPNPSVPIPIRGSKHKRTRHHSTKRDSKVSTNGDPNSLAKLPAVDSDEEAEMVQLTSNKITSSSTSDPFGREHPFTPMVNREMLCNLVRRSFDQTEEQQAMFEQSLRHEYGRRSKGEILAKELAGQLQMLDNNAHPFYKPRLFVTRNGYDLWLQAEKQRVRNLIEKFWHYSLPRPQLWRHYSPTDYHRAYSILLQKIICCESRTERKEPAHAGRTPSAPLSPTAQRLLTEFGYRYGVGELFRRIVYLDYLARHFDYEVWYIKHCTEELRGIRDLLPRSRNKITAVRKEMEMLRSTVHLLHGQTDNSLTRIDRLFLDSDPREGVASLIELLAEVLDAEQSLFGKKVRPVEDWLKRYLKSGFVLRYERRKEIAYDETVLTTTAQPFVLTPTLVNSLLLDTRDEVYNYRDKFQPVFNRYFDIVPFSKLEFYRLLCADACSLCARTIHTQESRKSISLEMVGLMYRLNERDVEWQNVVPPELQLWRQHFVNLALIWMDVLGKQINQWVVSSVARDQWSLLAFQAHLDHFSVNPTLPTKSTTAHFSVPSGVNNPQIVSSIRPSPFPSPIYNTRDHGLSPGPLSSVRTQGAFTPYKQPLLKRLTISPLSESSGAVTTDPGSSSSGDISGGSHSIAGEFPPIITNGIGDNRDGPLLKYCNTNRRAPESGSSSNDEMSTVHPPREIEVSASVYSGYDPSEGDWPADQSLDQEVQQKQLSPDMLSSPAPLDTPISPVSQDQSEETQHEESIGDTADITGTTATHTITMTSSPPPHVGKPQPIKSQPQETVHPSTENVNPMQSQPPLQPSQENPDSDFGPIDVNVKIVEPAEFARRDRSQQQQQQVLGSEDRTKGLDMTSSSDFHPSLSIDTLDPKVKLKPTVKKFGNLLENCNDEGSDVAAPKPRVVEASKTSKDAFNSFERSTATDELHIPPASVATVPELGDWVKEHPRRDTVTVGSSPDSYSGAESTDHADSQDTLKQTGSNSIEVRTTSDTDSNPSPNSTLDIDPSELLTTFLFPVSNSPVDIVTMLTRLAEFTGVLLEVLSPKLKTSSVRLDRKSGAEEYPSEVANAREHALQQQRFADNMRKEFLKKLHRVMLNAFKLYADNLLCMDLCCWPGGDASRLLGDEKVQNLNRRKETGQIWGCRHMVEERYGLHPNGMPCQRKNAARQFEAITRDMCIRINNIHTLITIFTRLENHLYVTVRKAVQRPVSTFGYISSDTSDVLGNSPRGHIAKPNPHRTRPMHDDLLAVPSKDTASWPSSISPSLGPMEPDRDDPSRETGDERKGQMPDYGFRSKESQRLLEYLRDVQVTQLKMLCIRMNSFFRPALSQLLELKLGDCTIEKRLSPLVTFLDRHRYALQKYVYPDCYSKIMEYLWSYILQDLEEEAIKLRASKKPVTNKAQMLLQSVSLMIQFMHNEESGIPLDLLTTSSEYLLGLLDIMTRSTEQLIAIFNKLCAPQFTRSNLDLGSAPVAIDSRVLHNLRTQLHTYRKCFSGREFVDKVVEVGRFYETRSESEADTPITPRRAASSRVSSARVFSPTGQPIEYTVRYAVELAQYLLNEGILIYIPQNATNDSNSVFTPPVSPDEDDQNHVLTFSTSYERAGGIDSGRPLNLSASLRGSSHGRSAPNTPQRNLGSRGGGASSIESRQSDSLLPYHYQTRENTRRNIAAEFSYTAHVFYKFADSEDADSAALYQSQILMASSLQTQQSSGSDGEQNGLRAASLLRDERNDFNSARIGTLYLVYDLLVQRSRKERRARQFLQSPRAITEAERRRAAGNVNCDLIFKM